MSPERLILGTRGSRLALVQAGSVADSLRRAVPELEIVLRTISTEGDRVQSPLPDALPSWGQGVFARDIESALLRGEIDFAVHSLKDLTATLPEGLEIAAVPPREDPSDVLVSADGRSLDELPRGARVGTSSLRRAAFLRAYRPDLQPVPLRGNVDTRWRKLLDLSQGYDAIVLAAAGLVRLGLDEAQRWPIPLDLLLPAPGQGALALQCRAGDATTRALLASIDHPPSVAAVRAERQVLRDLEGGCRLPVAALASPRSDGTLHLAGAVAAPDGSRVLRAELAGPIARPEELGVSLAARLLERGAAELLRGAATHQNVPKPRILVTRPADRADALCADLVAAGCEPVLVPTVRIELVPDLQPLDEALRRLASYRWVVLASVTAARVFAERSAALDLGPDMWAGVDIVTGPATARVLTAAGLPPTRLVAPFSARAVLASLAAEPLAGTRVLLPRAEGGRDELASGLRALGAAVDEIVVYRTVPITGSPDLLGALAGGVIGALFFSPSAVRGFAAAVRAGGETPERALLHAAVACLGPTTAAEARAHGLRVDVVPPDSTATSLVTALMAHVGATAVVPAAGVSAAGAPR